MKNFAQRSVALFTLALAVACQDRTPIQRAEKAPATQQEVDPPRPQARRSSSSSPATPGAPPSASVGPGTTTPPATPSGTPDAPPHSTAPQGSAPQSPNVAGDWDGMQMTLAHPVWQVCVGADFSRCI